MAGRRDRLRPQQHPHQRPGARLRADADDQRWIDDPAVLQGLMANSPMGRAAKPEEITGLVLCLCSGLASFATGQAFIIDGAQTTH